MKNRKIINNIVWATTCEDCGKPGYIRALYSGITGKLLKIICIECDDQKYRPRDEELAKL